MRKKPDGPKRRPEEARRAQAEVRCEKGQAGLTQRASKISKGRGLLCHGRPAWEYWGSRSGVEADCAPSGRRRKTARAFSRWSVTLRHCKSCSVAAPDPSPDLAARSGPSVRQTLIASRPQPPQDDSAMRGRNCSPWSRQRAAVLRWERLRSS